MAYPGEESKMSNYGVKEPSPEEVVGHWKECIKHEGRIHTKHLATKGNGTSIWPGTKQREEDLIKDADQYKSFFAKTKEHEYVHGFDRTFHITEGYNSKLHRDDRQHTVGLDMLCEEKRRSVPVRSSSEYGRRVEVPLEDPVRQFVRVERVMKGFYRSRGTGIPTADDERMSH